MFYTIRGLLNARGVPLENTVYSGCSDGMLDFRIASGEFYEIPDEEQGMLRFKNTANIMSFSQLAEVLHGLNDAELHDREKLPYCGENLEKISERLKKDPDFVSVEGGPCLFGEHEVTGEVRFADGRVFQFDYSTGKRYTEDASGAYDLMDPLYETDLAEFMHLHASEIEDVSFRSDKTGLTKQEYLHVLIPFAFASALKVSLVLTLPDMSYRKYLENAVQALPEGMAADIMGRFDRILYEICDMYLDLVRRLQAHFQIPRLAVVHKRDPELVQKFENARIPYIERNKILRHLTDRPAKLEPIKDYISMPALPFYLWGSKAILEINSMDETDSYRKCRKAHKDAFDLGCILFPELLSGDGVNTLYCAPLPYKGYKDYSSALELEGI